MVQITSICRLTVLTGPSGVGKGTLVRLLLKRYEEIWMSVSATTRLPREGEKDGEDYFFLTRDRFVELIQDQGFLEWAEFAGNSYGTLSRPVHQKLSEGRPVLLEIELEGARQVRKNFPEALLIFIAPPTFEELESRIRGRATDTEQAIQSRLARAREELMAKDEFDVVVINDDIQVALMELERNMGLTFRKDE